jgi:hypothetical protein
MEVSNCFAALPLALPGSTEITDEVYQYAGCTNLPLVEAVRNPDSLMQYAMCKSTFPPKSGQSNFVVAVRVKRVREDRCFGNGYLTDRTALEREDRERDQRGAAAHGARVWGGTGRSIGPQRREELVSSLDEGNAQSQNRTDSLYHRSVPGSSLAL